MGKPVQWSQRDKSPYSLHRYLEPAIPPDWAEPRQWQVLDAVIGLTMLAIALMVALC
jgi:hypothetical protein